MRTKRINTISIVLWFCFMYLWISVYIANFSDNKQRHYLPFNNVLADIQFTDSQDSTLWYNADNGTASLVVTAPWDLTVVQWSPVYIAPPPSRCTH